MLQLFQHLPLEFFSQANLQPQYQKYPYLEWVKGHNDKAVQYEQCLESAAHLAHAYNSCRQVKRPP